MELTDKVDLTYAKDGERVLLWAGRLIDGKSEISVNYALACAAAALFNQRETVLPALKALTAKVDALGSVELTDAQVAALADRVAAHPSLAEQIAEKVAAKLAERLAE